MRLKREHAGGASARRVVVAASRRRAAFSLLELLAAVGVIAVLLAVTLPALSRARSGGRAAQCAGILHNAALAMTMYLDENDGSFWPYKVDWPNPDGGRQWWFGFEPGGPAPNASQTHRPLDKSRGFLTAYLTGTAEDFLCPAFPYDGGRYFPKFAPPAGGYGYNTAALGGFNWIDPALALPRKIQQFDGRTADVFALADGIHFDKLDYSSTPPLAQRFNEPPYIQWQPPAYFGSNVGVNGGYGHFRHLDRANVLFLDGHVAAQPPRRTLHPYSAKGYGPVANLSDEALRVREVVKGSQTLEIDVIYGLE